MYYKHGWDTYLTCLADLCKHTSGCSANKSRLYCPLTSAELLIVNVTQLQRRAFTVDWGSLSVTGWLTAANASHLSNHMKHIDKHMVTARHAPLNCRAARDSLPQVGLCPAGWPGLQVQDLPSPTCMRDFYQKKKKQQKKSAEYIVGFEIIFFKEEIDNFLW